jgi:hypothetical protein
VIYETHAPVCVAASPAPVARHGNALIRDWRRPVPLLALRMFSQCCASVSLSHACSLLLRPAFDVGVFCKNFNCFFNYFYAFENFCVTVVCLLIVRILCVIFIKIHLNVHILDVIVLLTLVYMKCAHCFTIM